MYGVYASRLFSSTVTKGQQSLLVDWVCCHMSSVSFYVNSFFSVRLSVILMKLGVNDTRERG